MQYLTGSVEGNIVGKKNDKNTMSGLTFRVPAYHVSLFYIKLYSFYIMARKIIYAFFFKSPPLFSITRNQNGTYSYSGATTELFNLVSDYFNLKYCFENYSLHINH